MADDFTAGWQGGDDYAFLVEVEQVAVAAEDVTATLLGEFRDLHAEQMDRAFWTEGATTANGAWRPLSPRTKRGRGILQRSGDLKRSYSDPAHPDFAFELRQNEVVVGSNHKLAQIHENGAPRAGIPRRSVAKSTEDIDALDEVVWQGILNPKNGA